MIGCSERKDDTKEKLLFNYFVNCSGGTKQACTDTCSQDKCGVAVGGSVTPDVLECVNNCVTTCTQNCDLTGLVLIFMEE